MSVDGSRSFDGGSGDKATERFDISIIGAGAVGSALSRALYGAGHSIVAVMSRTEDSAHELAAEVRAPHSGADLGELPACQVILLCVPDDEIASVAQELAATEHDWDDVTIAHTSGVLSSTILEPVAQHGVSVLSLHPLVAVPQNASPSVFNETYAVLEGERDAVSTGRALMKSIGVESVELQSGAKQSYHAAATLLSNGIVALADMAVELLQEGGIDEVEATRLLGPLAMGTCQNLREKGPAGALTGPVSRGDAKTVELHLQALKNQPVELLQVYQLLAQRLIRIASDKGLISDEAKSEIQHLLRRSYSEKSSPQVVN